MSSPPADAQSTIPISDFVKRLKPDARTGFLTLRALAVNLGPDVVEQVTPNAVIYLRRDRMFLKVEALRASRVTAAFPPAVTLEDPMGRLLRRGDERYFRIEKPDDMDGHLQEFVRKAYAASRS